MCVCGTSWDRTVASDALSLHSMDTLGARREPHVTIRFSYGDERDKRDGDDRNGMLNSLGEIRLAWQISSGSQGPRHYLCAVGRGVTAVEWIGTTNEVSVPMVREQIAWTVPDSTAADCPPTQSPIWQLSHEGTVRRLRAHARAGNTPMSESKNGEGSTSPRALFLGHGPRMALRPTWKTISLSWACGRAR